MLHIFNHNFFFNQHLKKLKYEFIIEFNKLSNDTNFIKNGIKIKLLK